jgi:hypothetical protein
MRNFKAKSKYIADCFRGWKVKKTLCKPAISIPDVCIPLVLYLIELATKKLWSNRNCIRIVRTYSDSESLATRCGPSHRRRDRSPQDVKEVGNILISWNDTDAFEGANPFRLFPWDVGKDEKDTG